MIVMIEASIIYSSVTNEKQHRKSKAQPNSKLSPTTKWRNICTTPKR